MTVLEDIPKNTFRDLQDHMTETGVTDNHVFPLIKAVARSYLKIRMHHIGKEFNQLTMKNARCRKKLSKLVLFKNQ